VKDNRGGTLLCMLLSVCVYLYVCVCVSVYVCVCMSCCQAAAPAAGVPRSSDQSRPSAAALENRRRSSPSRVHELKDQPPPAGNNGRHRRPSPVGGRDFPVSRPAARGEAPGPRAGVPAGQRMDSPHRVGRHHSPAAPIADQFSRPARHDSPVHGFRRSQHLPQDVASSAPDDSNKPVMLSSSDIILRPAMPPSSDQKHLPLSRK